MAAAEFSPTCNQHLFDRYVDSCLSQFQESMELSGYQDSCPWPGVKSVYNQLKSCVDFLAEKTRCKGYGSLVDDVYLAVHQMYFVLCGQVRDPPMTTLILLIAPCVVATLISPLLCFRSRTEG
uniref:Receptor activity modifying protein 1 n=1 Tax=Cynoglossus semilaevis TaxID=244447 RepID=A0A3P8WG28_CYNSE